MLLNHSEWGEATVLCPRDFIKPPEDTLNYCQNLQNEDREKIRLANNGLIVSITPKQGNVLRDGKLALRYFNALMANNGVAVYNVQSSKFWTPEMLADELCHDADLDVEALYNIHCVCETDKENVYWIHSHGLKEIGFFDFSIIKPSDDINPDFYRSLAFAIVEGKAKIGAKTCLTLSPKRDAFLVSMQDFLLNGDLSCVELIKDDIDDYHCDKVAVLCEAKDNWLTNLFQKIIQPSKTLINGLPENGLLSFSTPASNLMSERANDTYHIFRQVKEELNQLRLPMQAMVKMGYVVDNGRLDKKEHLWFEVESFADETVNAILLNQPYQIARMNKGDLGTHPVKLLSDWVIMTPFGNITPRSYHLARVIKNIPPNVIEELQKAFTPE